MTPELTNPEPDNKRHVTLVNFEDGADHEAIKSCLKNAAMKAAPIAGKISGTGHFMLDEGKKAYYASYDSAQLPALRQAIIDELDAQGIGYSTDHGFSPHITLQYSDNSDLLGLQLSNPIDYTFSHLTYANEDDLTHFGLGTGDLWVQDSELKAMPKPDETIPCFDPEARKIAKFKAIPFVSADSFDGIIDVLYAPYERTDGDGQTFFPDTRFHNEDKIVPGILDFHGAAFGGLPIDVGHVVERWTDTNGKWARIQLDKGNVQYPVYLDAIKRGNLFVSPGAIDGYFKYDDSGRITDWATGEISLVVADGAKRPKNWYAIARPRSEAILKAVGVGYEPLVGGAYLEKPKETMKTRKSLDTRLTGLLRKFLSALDLDPDLVNLKINKLQQDPEDPTQPDATEVIETIAEQIVEVHEQTETPAEAALELADQVEIANAVAEAVAEAVNEVAEAVAEAADVAPEVVNQEAPVEVQTGPTPEEQKQMDEAQKVLEEKDAQLADLRSQLDALSRAKFKAETTAWVDAQVVAGKVLPAEKDEIVAAVTTLNQGEVALKASGGNGGLVDVFKRSIENRQTVLKAEDVTLAGFQGNNADGDNKAELAKALSYINIQVK